MKNRYLCDLKGSKTGYDLLPSAGERLIFLLDLESKKLNVLHWIGGGVVGLWVELYIAVRPAHKYDP